MNTLTLAITLVALGITLATSAILIVRHVRKKPLTPFQSIFQNAIDHINEFGLMQHGFTPRGQAGIGLGLPHCIHAAVAAFDPEYERGKSLYMTDAANHLRATAQRRFGVFPEIINDERGLDDVLALLRFAIADAPTNT